MRADSWDEPARNVTATSTTAGDRMQCAPVQPGNRSQAEPVSGRHNPGGRADRHDGDLSKVPLPNEPEPGTPDVRDVVTTLPEGMTLAPPIADGLQACSETQFGLGTESGPGSAHTEPAKSASCPLASQIGTVEAVTPLLDKHLQGQLFLAEPECGDAADPEPCSNEYAEGRGGASHERKLYNLYLQIDNPKKG